MHVRMVFYPAIHEQAYRVGMCMSRGEIPFVYKDQHNGHTASPRIIVADVHDQTNVALRTGVLHEVLDDQGPGREGRHLTLSLRGSILA